MMIAQRTIARKFQITGVGIHSGRKVTCVLHPAPADFGIQLRRSDIMGSPLVKACVEAVSATDNNTTLGKSGHQIYTVEHLLAVLYGFGIDNVLCEVDGPEIPIMDGSGSSFIYLIKEIGVRNLNAPKKFLVVTKTVRVEVGDKWAQLSPSPQLIIDSTIVFSHPKIKTQNEVFEFSCEAFIEKIGRARTFCLLKDVDQLKRKGLIKGGSLDNAIVLDDFKVMNTDGLRFANEFVRHKILDTLGDLSLLGFEIAAKVQTYKSGHELHNRLCQKLLETENAFEIVSSLDLDPELSIQTQKAFALPAHFIFAK